MTVKEILVTGIRYQRREIKFLPNGSKQRAATPPFWN